MKKIFNNFLFCTKYFFIKKKIKCTFFKYVVLNFDFFCADNLDKKSIQALFFSDFFCAWASQFIFQNSLCRVEIHLTNKIKIKVQKKIDKMKCKFFVCIQIIKILNNDVLADELKFIFLYKYRFLKKQLLYDLKSNNKKFSIESKNKKIEKKIIKCTHKSIVDLKLSSILCYFYQN